MTTQTYGYLHLVGNRAEDTGVNGNTLDRARQCIKFLRRKGPDRYTKFIEVTPDSGRMERFAKEVMSAFK